MQNVGHGLKLQRSGEAKLSSLYVIATELFDKKNIITFSFFISDSRLQTSKMFSWLKKHTKQKTKTNCSTLKNVSLYFYIMTESVTMP